MGVVGDHGFGLTALPGVEGAGTRIEQARSGHVEEGQIGLVGLTDDSEEEALRQVLGDLVVVIVAFDKELAEALVLLIEECTLGFFDFFDC